MSDRRTILAASFRIAVVLTATAGLALLFVPGIARGLGRPEAVPPWALGRHDPLPPVEEHLLEAAGLRVSGAAWRRNREAWDQLSDPQRRVLLERYERLRGADDSRRAVLVERYKSLRQLSAADRDRLRRQAAHLARFEATLSREDLAVLDSLSPPRRARHLDGLWHASQGLD